MISAARALGVLLLATAPLAAQSRAPTLPGCPAAWVVGDLGVNGLRCHNCQIRGKASVGATWIKFGGEPEVMSVRGAGLGKLEQGDIIVAIDSVPITTPEGSRRYSQVKAGQSVKLTVRRNDRVVELVIVAGPMCGDPPAPPRVSRI